MTVTPLPSAQADPPKIKMRLSLPIITPARKFRMLLHPNPTRERGECLGTRAGASEDR